MGGKLKTNNWKEFREKLAKNGNAHQKLDERSGSYK